MSGKISNSFYYEGGRQPRSFQGDGNHQPVIRRQIEDNLNRAFQSPPTDDTPYQFVYLLRKLRERAGRS